MAKKTVHMRTQVGKGRFIYQLLCGAPTQFTEGTRDISKVTCKRCRHIYFKRKKRGDIIQK